MILCMGRVYAQDVSGTVELNEGQEIICRVNDIDGKLIEYEAILDAGNYARKDSIHSEMLSDVHVGDKLIFEYQGGTAFSLVDVE